MSDAETARRRAGLEPETYDCEAVLIPLDYAAHLACEEPGFWSVGLVAYFSEENCPDLEWHGDYWPLTSLT